MGTKNNAGPYDCHAKAHPDEPLFTVLGRDPQGADLVMLWAMLRNKDKQGARCLVERMIARASALPFRPGDPDKINEAIACSQEMSGVGVRPEGDMTRRQDALLAICIAVVMLAIYIWAWS